MTIRPASSRARCGPCAHLLRGALAFALVGSLAPAALGDECSGPTCCVGGPWLGCSDLACCDQVCAVDPLCCAAAWDAPCSNLARELCGICLPRDCDGNGVADFGEYGQTALIALRSAASRDDPEEAFCPKQPLGPQNVVVLTGPAGYAPRQFVLNGSPNQPFGGILVADVAATVFASPATGAGSPPGVLAATGRVAPAELLVVGLGGSVGPIVVTSLVSVDPSSIEIVSGEFTTGGFNVARGRIAVGTTEGHSTVVSSGLIQVTEAGAIDVGPDSTLVALSDVEIRGRLSLAGSRVVAADLRGTSASSRLVGSGEIVGSVSWSGTITPGRLSIAGDLSLEPVDGATPSRVVHRLAETPLLSVGGAAALAGNLVIDATGTEPTAGTVFPIVRSATGFGTSRFESVGVVGIDPTLAVITRVRQVTQPSGGTAFEVQGVVVAANAVISFGDSARVDLDLVPEDATRADFDGDGLVDVAVTVAGPKEGAVVVFRGTGKGLVQELLVPLAGGVRGIDAGDLDGDGRPDLCVALFDADALQVLRNASEPGSGSIGFGPLEPTPIGDGPIDVALLDFDADDGAMLAGSKLDAFVAVAIDESFALVKNENGTLSGTNATTLPSPGGPPTSVGDGDVDNDRDDDAVGGTEGGTVVLPGGSGGGSSSAQGLLYFPTPNPVAAIAVADLSGDGVPEVLASLEALAPRPAPPGTPPSYDSLVLYRSTSVGIASSILDVGPDAGAIVVGDLDGDGDGDVTVAARPSEQLPRQVRLLRNDSTPWGFSLNEVGTAEALGAPGVLTTVSIDGIGEDLVGLAPAGSGGGGELVLLRTIDPPSPGDLNGDGVVGQADLALLLSYWGFPGLSDLNRDGTTNALDLAELLALWTQDF